MLFVVIRKRFWLGFVGVILLAVVDISYVRIFMNKNIKVIMWLMI